MLIEGKTITIRRLGVNSPWGCLGGSLGVPWGSLGMPWGGLGDALATLKVELSPARELNFHVFTVLPFTTAF